MNDLITAESTELFERILRLSVANGSASPRTLTAYRQSLASFLAYMQNKSILPLHATYDDIEEYRNSLLGYSKATIKLRLVGVKALYKAFQRWGKRPDNPADGVRAPKDKEDAHSKVLKKALSPKEVGELLKVLPTDKPLHRAVILLMLYHGLRAGEISNITHEAGNAYISVIGKGGKVRAIMLSKDALGLLPLDLDGLKGLSVKSVERIVDRYLMMAGLKKKGRSAHSLRHAHGMLATLGGADLQALAYEMGHASVATTDIYTRCAAAYQANPGDAVSLALVSANNPLP